MEHYEIQVVGHLDQRRAHALGCERLRTAVRRSIRC